MERINLMDLKKQYLSVKHEIDEAIAHVIEHSSFIKGEDLRKFEQEFAKACNMNYALGCDNGTAALYLALKALDLKKGDEVITVPNSFIATSEAITAAGAKVKFVDIDEHTYNINPELIHDAITKKTKAIVPVHLYGRMSPMEEIKAIAESNKLKIVEDAAQAHLAEYKGKKPGFYGDLATYSFFPAKNLGCFGDAGCVTTDNEEYEKKISLFLDHGRIDKYNSIIEGFNYRMDTIQAAVLRVKLRHLEKWTERKIEIAKMYNKMLKDVVVTPRIEPDYRHVFYVYTIRARDRDKLQEFLKEKGIATQIYYPIPLHLQPAYKYLKHKEGDFPVSEKISNEILSIPIHEMLRNDEVKYIADCIKDFYAKY
jgi:dTDP-4-amino-4,6-dideoxygalactose transaminase